jgi:hypothetical protein
VRGEEECGGMDDEKELENKNKETNLLFLCHFHTYIFREKKHN